MPAIATTGEKGTDDVRSRALAARTRMIASGTNISEWARDRGFSAKAVHEVLRGERPCIRGKSHRIAVALGIKADVAAPGADRGHSGADNLAVAP